MLSSAMLALTLLHPTGEDPTPSPPPPRIEGLRTTEEGGTETLEERARWLKRDRRLLWGATGAGVAWGVMTVASVTLVTIAATKTANALEGIKDADCNGNILQCVDELSQSASSAGRQLKQAKILALTGIGAGAGALMAQTGFIIRTLQLMEHRADHF